MSEARPYVVVLAGGQGNRLASLTRALYGVDLPKQFAVLAGDRSLLQTTVERAAALTSLDRISVVVGRGYEELAREQLAPYPGVDIVVQPRNLDTAPGMLLPLARILARAPHARVVFLPSDHYIPNPEPITSVLHRTDGAALHDRIALVGVAPTGPEVEYGWIIRGDRLANGAFAIKRFHEKPSHTIADELWRAGGLWNTFISTGPAQVFWDLAIRYVPIHAALLAGYTTAIGTPHEAATLDDIYAVMTAANFSRDVLAHARSLAVLPVAGSGWSDWGSPARVFESLVGTDCHARLVDRIRHRVAA